MYDPIRNATATTALIFANEIDPDFDSFAIDPAQDDFLDRHLLALRESLLDERNF